MKSGPGTTAFVERHLIDGRIDSVAGAGSLLSQIGKALRGDRRSRRAGWQQ